jgi:hypothetical protein
MAQSVTAGMLKNTSSKMRLPESALQDRFVKMMPAQFVVALRLMPNA